MVAGQRSRLAAFEAITGAPSGERAAPPRLLPGDAAQDERTPVACIEVGVRDTCPQEVLALALSKHHTEQAVPCCRAARACSSTGGSSASSVFTDAGHMALRTCTSGLLA